MSVLGSSSDLLAQVLLERGHAGPQDAGVFDMSQVISRCELLCELLLRPQAHAGGAERGEGRAARDDFDRWVRRCQDLADSVKDESRRVQDRISIFQHQRQSRKSWLQEKASKQLKSMSLAGKVWSQWRDVAMQMREVRNFSRREIAMGRSKMQTIWVMREKKKSNLLWWHHLAKNQRERREEMLRQTFSLKLRESKTRCFYVTKLFFHGWTELVTSCKYKRKVVSSQLRKKRRALLNAALEQWFEHVDEINGFFVFKSMFDGNAKFVRYQPVGFQLCEAAVEEAHDRNAGVEQNKKIVVCPLEMSWRACRVSWALMARRFKERDNLLRHLALYKWNRCIREK